MRTMTIEIPLSGATDREQALIDAIKEFKHPFKVKFLGSIWFLTGFVLNDDTRMVLNIRGHYERPQRTSPPYYSLTFQRI